ncbi:MAG: hypothetical protein ACNS63_00390 [Candidatus Nitrospinota bacterium M3_3B_026]
MRRLIVPIAALGLVFTIACGSSGDDGSSDGSSETVYTGAITQTFTAGTGGARNQSLTCVFEGGAMTLTLHADGTITGSSGGGESASAACQYVSEAAEAEWSGTFENGEFTVQASGSGVYAVFEASASGTYDEDSLTGSGSGSVTVTTPSGAAQSFTATYSFTLTAA